MSGVDLERLDLASERLEQGFHSHAEMTTRQPTTDLANDLAALHDEALDLQLTEGEPVSNAEYQIDTTTLRRLRKITEIIEDDLDVNLGHNKFAQLASTASTVNSMVALSVAGWNLLLSADSLDRAAASVDSVSEIETVHFDEFYRALGIFFLECFLFTTPFNYKIAWQGTRYLNNRFLYRLRRNHIKLYRLILSEIHYAIRGLTEGLLRQVEAFSSYLTTMTTQTVKILEQQSGKDLDDILVDIGDIVTEFKLFAKNYYGIAIPNIDLQTIVQNVITEVSEFADIPAFSASDVTIS